MSLKIDTKSLADAFAASSSQVKKSDGGSGFGALLKQAESKQSKTLQELQEYMKMSPEERMVQAIMKKLGITKEKFDALSPAEQAGVMAKVAKMLQQQMEEAAHKQGAAPSDAL